MLTFFTIPKPFKGHSGLIQTNAILSWKELKPECQIIVYGKDYTISEFCEKNGITYIDDFETNEYGTPLLDSIWKSAKSISSNDLICYINSDIILFPDFAEKIRTVKLKEFLIAGRRWDLDINYLMDFDLDWENSLKDLVKKEGSLHSETGADYFLFPKDIMPPMPPFAIGRTTWDNWLFNYFSKLKCPIIDGTFNTIIHQNHDYDHIKTDKTKSFKGTEAIINFELANLKYWEDKNIADSTYILSENGIKKVSLSKIIFRVYQRYFLTTLSKIKKIEI